jgi:RNA polymerase sigma-70 factor (ECF subfamily)
MTPLDAPTIDAAMTHPRSTALSLVAGTDVVDRTTRPSRRVPRDPGPHEAESDAELVGRALCGDPQSKERLYLRHVDYVMGMSVRLLRSIDAGEDVVQDAFVIAFEQLATLRNAAAFRGWLASIAVSQARRRLSRWRLTRLLGLDTSLDEAPLDSLAREDTSAEVRSELAALDRALQALPVNHRIAWMLRYVEDEPLEAVAESCGCSLATVKRWIAAADERVRSRVHFTEGRP